MLFQMFDIALIGVMLISGFLAFMRGFTRELLSLLTWGVAAIASYLTFQSEGLLRLATSYIESEIIARIAVIGSVFLIVLVALSLVTMKLANLILESGIGSIDRTLGFVFGLARGLLLVTVAYVFLATQVPPDVVPSWIKQARTLNLVDRIGDHVVGALPTEIQEILRSPAGTVSTDEQDGGTPDEAGSVGDGLNDSNRRELDRTIQNQETQ